MTCIVGIAHDKNVYIGGDRGASDDHSIISLAQPKVRIQGSWIYGYAGSLGNGQLIDHIVFPPIKRGDDPYKIIRFDIMPLLKSLIESHGSIKDDDATDYLIGCKGRLFEMSTDDWGLVEINEVAIGSGGSYALGSLHSTYNTNNSPIIRIQMALDAAITYSPTCQGPTDILHV